ncbi:MAG: ribose 5-phosphate isomerase B [Oscillospiraceae bacterium]|nr:ribose 5-phosphate isomerase B [Oscillospiraceae bacterium]
MIAIGSDHGGYALKQEVMAFLDSKGIAYRDYGCYTEESCDYPDIAEPVCAAVVNGEAEKGILICGTGIGISMSANKIKGIRAALCSDYYSAKYTRLHNDANVICMGGRTVGGGIACELVDVFLHTDFEGGRHQRRVDKVMALENK